MHWEWQEEKNSVLRHGTVVRPSKYVASLDIKTAFDDAKPKHVAQILDSHNTHGLLIAPLLREMSEQASKAMFDCMESCFSFNRCLRQGSVAAPALVAENGHPVLDQCGRRMDDEKKWYFLGPRG